MNFAKRKFELRSEQARQSAIDLIRNLPLCESKPLMITVEAFKKQRGLDANALMWAGPLKDISEQAWLDGRQYSAEIWAHYFKEQLLPDEFDDELCLSGYEKWAFDPAGNRVLTGSTTKLTVKGMAQHIEAIHAFGASLGVIYHTKE
jgi:NinB protein.